MNLVRSKFKGSARSFLADRRGAVALELPAVWLFLMFSLLLPLADVAIAGFKYISAKQALRNFGQSIQYSTPPDVTNLSAGSWLSKAQAKAAVAALDSNHPISAPQVYCGGVICTDATATPKYYKFSTTVTLTPILLKSLLCTSGTGDGCTFTLVYSERFQ